MVSEPGITGDTAVEDREAVPGPDLCQWLDKERLHDSPFIRAAPKVSKVRSRQESGDDVGGVEVNSFVGLLLGMLIGLAAVAIIARLRASTARAGRADYRQRQSRVRDDSAASASWRPRKRV